MAEITGITWTDSTFNPWIGCTKIGQGCDHCYAEHLMDTRLHRVNWGPGQPRKRTSASNWRQPLLWEREHEAFALAHGRRRRVFCASLADVFDNEVETAWRDDLFQLIEKTPNLTWLVLTKRIGNAQHQVWPRWMQRRFPPNLWLGITVVNQAEADRDIPKLLATPARVRFLSLEPMLGPIDLTHIRKDRFWRINALAGDYWREEEDETGFRSGETFERVSQVHWVIVGGESGANARPFHVGWARSIVKQCQAAGVPVHVKQLGAQPRGWCAGMAHVEPEEREGWDCDFYEAHEQGAECPGRCAAMVDRAGGDPSEWPEDLRVQQWPALEGPKA